MEEKYSELRIFLSSPGDVAEERKIVEGVIKKVSGIIKEPLNMFVELVKWEDFAPMASTDETIQEMINQEIKKCHVFLLIINKRYGSYEEGAEKSNTEREIDTALKMKELNKKIKFLAYFRKLPRNEDPGNQETKIEELKGRLQAQGVLFDTYDGVEDFKETITHKLYETAIKFRQSTHKRKALSTFWQLGVPERYTRPRLAVMYPPMTFSHLKPVNPETFWYKRILPNVLYEDIKAVEKVEKTLRLLGFRDFRTYAATNVPTDINFMNRVWVCQARIGISYEYLKKYDNRAQFQFVPPKKGREARLKWRYSQDSEDFIEIQSPLSKYLQEQRKTMDVSGGWKREMGMVVAKDYAILARFRNIDKIPPMREGYLYDYFIAGIRGLGTWGAAYFIDRYYQYFEEYSELDDLQILIEVTYKEDRIFDVKVVSDQPEHYFKEQLSTKVVKNTIGEDIF
jgi:hypothetical protein